MAAHISPPRTKLEWMLKEVTERKRSRDWNLSEIPPRKIPSLGSSPFRRPTHTCSSEASSSPVWSTTRDKGDTSPTAASLRKPQITSEEWKMRTQPLDAQKSLPTRQMHNSNRSWATELLYALEAKIGANQCRTNCSPSTVLPLLAVLGPRGGRGQSGGMKAPTMADIAASISTATRTHSTIPSEGSYSGSSAQVVSEHQNSTEAGEESKCKDSVKTSGLGSALQGTKRLKLFGVQIAAN